VPDCHHDMQLPIFECVIVGYRVNTITEYIYIHNGEFSCDIEKGSTVELYNNYYTLAKVNPSINFYIYSSLLRVLHSETTEPN